MNALPKPCNWTLPYMVAVCSCAMGCKHCIEQLWTSPLSPPPSRRSRHVQRQVIGAACTGSTRLHRTCGAANIALRSSRPGGAAACTPCVQSSTVQPSGSWSLCFQAATDHVARPAGFQPRLDRTGAVPAAAIACQRPFLDRNMYCPQRSTHSTQRSGTCRGRFSPATNATCSRP